MTSAKIIVYNRYHTPIICNRLFHLNKRNFVLVAICIRIWRESLDLPLTDSLCSRKKNQSAHWWNYIKIRKWIKIYVQSKDSINWKFDLNHDNIKLQHRFWHVVLYFDHFIQLSYNRVSKNSSDQNVCFPIDTF